MASARQIAANRRNAKKSTGPKSDSGKKRSSKNAYHHGLSIPRSAVESEAQLKDLARQFAGEASDARIPSLAERAADGHLDLERVRRVQTAMIERALMLDAPGAGPLDSCMEELRHRIGQTDWPGATRGESLPQPEMFYPSTPLPHGKEEEERRFAEAVRHILPDLTKICHYEKRAAGRRDRAIRKIVSLKTANKKSCYSPSHVTGAPKSVGPQF
jgi:hypothetical protein